MQRLTKTYGAGETAVHALAGVDLTHPARRLRRGHGRLRLGQVDPDEHHRLPRRRHQRVATCSTASTSRRLVEQAALPDPQPQDRVHLPELQPDSPHVGAAQRRAASGLRRHRGGGASTPSRSRRWSGSGSPTACTTRRPSSPADSSSGSQSHVPSPPSRSCCSLTSPRAPWTATAPPMCCSSSTSSPSRGRTVVVITHEDEVAQHAKRIILMTDGRSSPTFARLASTTCRRDGRPAEVAS